MQPVKCQLIELESHENTSHFGLLCSMPLNVSKYATIPPKDKY